MKLPIIRNREDRCLQYKCAVGQLMTEVFQGHGRKGTEGYRRIGCYDCEGYDRDCSHYITLRGLGEVK